MSDATRVLVACEDATFVRLAAVALSRSGYAVRTVRLEGVRLARLLAEDATDVLVVDSAVVADDARRLIDESGMRVGIVRVREEGELGITKWGPLAALTAEVQIAAEAAHAHTNAPRLRIVS